MLREVEDFEGCSVDTSGTRIDIPNLVEWSRVQVVPIPGAGGSGCAGWRGEPIPLRAAPNGSAQRLAYVQRGDDIGFSFEPEGDWEFVFTDKRGASGWMQSSPWSEDARGGIAG